MSPPLFLNNLLVRGGALVVVSGSVYATNITINQATVTTNQGNVSFNQMFAYGTSLINFNGGEITGNIMKAYNSSELRMKGTKVNTRILLECPTMTIINITTPSSSSFDVSTHSGYFEGQMPMRSLTAISPTNNNKNNIVIVNAGAKPIETQITISSGVLTFINAVMDGPISTTSDSVLVFKNSTYYSSGINLNIELVDSYLLVGYHYTTFLSFSTTGNSTIHLSSFGDGSSLQNVIIPEFTQTDADNISSLVNIIVDYGYIMQLNSNASDEPTPLRSNMNIHTTSTVILSGNFNLLPEQNKEELSISGGGTLQLGYDPSSTFSSSSPFSSNFTLTLAACTLKTPGIRSPTILINLWDSQLICSSTIVDTFIIYSSLFVSGNFQIEKNYTVWLKSGNLSINGNATFGGTLYGVNNPKDPIINNTPATNETITSGDFLVAQQTMPNTTLFSINFSTVSISDVSSTEYSGLVFSSKYTDGRLFFHYEQINPTPDPTTDPSSTSTSTSTSSATPSDDSASSSTTSQPFPKKYIFLIAGSGGLSIAAVIFAVVIYRRRKRDYLYIENLAM
eukprot:TRINITY_DN1171_c0_g2_i2.p1 TRINITY_DN1171_c0_g2~~TRINITY_DN1171_c0_g2_i2.p1  ORF type:complete len:566 (+),score=103.51 TRINITY_DN1171_c0_g2_i2:329-2026(+)